MSRYQIRGNVEHDGQVSQAIECDADFWSVYELAREPDLTWWRWVKDFPCRASAEAFVAQLEAV